MTTGRINQITPLCQTRPRLLSFGRRKGSTRPSFVLLLPGGRRTTGHWSGRLGREQTARSGFAMAGRSPRPASDRSPPDASLLSLRGPGRLRELAAPAKRMSAAARTAASLRFPRVVSESASRSLDRVVSMPGVRASVQKSPVGTPRGPGGHRAVPESLAGADL